MTLRARWLGRVRWSDAHALQRGLLDHAADDYLLLLEHPHVYTLGVRARPEHVLVEPASVGAELVRADRGGDVTYHGPGQLVGYPVVSVADDPGAGRRHVHALEELIVDVLAELGLPGAGRLEGYPGIWVGERKICAIGVRVARGRTMHGFALNVDPDLGMFDHIVPCGIRDKAVTSMAAEGVRVPMRDVVEAVVRRAAREWGGGGVERAGVAWSVRPEDLSAFSRGEGPGALVAVSGAGPAPRPAPGRGAARPPAEQPVRLLGRLAAAGTDPAAGLPLAERKPPWLRVRAEMGTDYRRLRHTMRSLDLVTVCEEAGCPNIYDCWADGTATFMINGDRCTRACGFCLVDTRRPQALDPSEPDRVAEAVSRMGLAHAVVTAVARDDLRDGGAAAFAETVAAVRRRNPGTAVEVLIPDFKGDAGALDAVFAARPDVLNHNLETVARLQRAVRPSASYARSLSVLARAKAAGLTAKSGLILGLGESVDEVLAALADLRSVGVDIVTVGQYLRPTANHLPVARWWAPEEFDDLRRRGEAMGFAHVQSSPLTRSSYHARQAAGSAGGAEAAAGVPAPPLPA